VIDRLPLRIGTRGSPLARAQTAQMVQRLQQARPDLAAPGAVAIVVIRTTGDVIRDRPLADIGGKGLFSKEIDEAMLAGRIDLAVHSVKDLPTALPRGLRLAAVLPRADPRDAFLSRDGRALAELPPGAVIGTASVRRRAQILARRPELSIAVMRGNVHTRLDKLQAGVVDGTLLAVAGLRRLGLDLGTRQQILPAEQMLPAVGQGAIGITGRDDDEAALAVAALLDDPATAAAVSAERAMLAALDGSCRTPIGGLAEVTAGGGVVRLRGLVAAPDGTRIIEGERSAGTADAAVIGHDLGAELKAAADPVWFAP
jgi:hydroxymethylbilane synthase